MPEEILKLKKPMFDQEQFAMEIAFHRRKNKISLRAASAQIGISAATLSRVERGGSPDIDTFSKIKDWVLGRQSIPGYKFSKDYEALYAFVGAGHAAFCLVDYREGFRDVCRCRKHGDFDISFGARGIEYMSIMSFDKEKLKTEKVLFLERCALINVEWAMP